MLRKDVEKLLLDISSNQRDHDAAQQAYIHLKELITTDSDLMKSYWDKIVSYLYRKNVYVRLRAASLLFELSPYVSDQQFDNILPVLLRQLESDSIVVASTFASHIPKLIMARPYLEEMILKRIFETDKWKSSSRNWQIVKASLIEALDQILDYSSKEDMIIRYIKQARLSSSPKTRKIANRVLKIRKLID
jgi:hypothetical protein